MDFLPCIGTKLCAKQIAAFLKRMDSEFHTPLSEKCDIDSYVIKLLESGHVVCVMDDSKIVGILAGYINDFKTKIGYMTVLVVDPQYRGLKLSKKLLDRFAADSKEAGMTSLELHTYKDNIAARGLYEKNNFKQLSVSSDGYCCYKREIE